MPWWGYAFSTIALYALQLAIIQNLVKDFHPAFMLSLRILPVMLLIFFLFDTVKLNLSNMLAAPAKTQFLLIFLVFSNMLGVFFQYMAIKGSSATHASLFDLMTPILTTLFVFLLFAEINFNLYTLFAAMLMLSGALLLIIKG